MADDHHGEYSLGEVEQSKGPRAPAGNKCLAAVGMADSYLDPVRSFAGEEDNFAAAEHCRRVVLVDYTCRNLAPSCTVGRYHRCPVGVDVSQNAGMLV